MVSSMSIDDRQHCEKHRKSATADWMSQPAAQVRRKVWFARLTAYAATKRAGHE
jgi:hypothetical protein